MNWRHQGALAIALAVALTAGSARQDPTAWTVDIHVDHPLDTMRSALSPWASAPGTLATPRGDLDSRIRYLCLNAEERAVGSLAPVMLLFRRPLVPRALAGESRRWSVPVELRTVWGDETVVFGATHRPGRDRINLSLDDRAERSGESSHDEFLRRLLEGSRTATDSVVVELEWEGAGPVRYAYSLEGAGASIREAGGPCGVG